MEKPNIQIEENNEIQNLEENDQIEFLELSVINEICQIVEQIDSKCKNQKGEDIVNQRIKELGYSKILVNIYEKDITYLIKAYTDLGLAYFDIEYYEQAQEHLLNALKMNEYYCKNDNLSMKEYQIKILTNLSYCYLKNGNLDKALKLSEESLLINKTLSGEAHVSNADIYYILANIHSELKNFELAIKNYEKMLVIYENEYGYDQEKSAKILMRMGNIYKDENNISEAIDIYDKAYKMWEKIINDQNYEVLFKIAIILSELYILNKEYDSAYEILDKNEKDYGDKVERSLKEKLDYQKCKIKACSYNKGDSILLEEYLKIEDILNEQNVNTNNLAKLCIKIGNLYFKTNEKDKGFEYYKKAENIYILNGDNKYAIDIHNKIMELQKKEQLKELKKEESD